MTIRELIDRLQEEAEIFGDDAEVRLATQANYPFQNSLEGVAAGRDVANAASDPDEPDPRLTDFNGDVDPDRVVYLVEGTQLGYGSREAWNVAR